MMLNFQMLVAPLLLGIVHPSSGQVVKFRSCLRPPVKANFSVNQYLGTWYEVRRYFPIFFEQNLICGTATYTLDRENKVNVYNRSINRFTKQLNDILGKAEIVSNAKLSVSFGDADQSFGSTPEGNYWVLDTDYQSFAIVYSCTEFFATVALEIVWVLGRTPTLPDNKLREIYSYLRARGIDTKPLDSRPDIQGSSDVDCRNYYMKY